MVISCQSMFHDQKSFNFEQTTTPSKCTSSVNNTTINNNNNGNQKFITTTTSLSIRDRLKTNLSLNNLEPRKNAFPSSCLQNQQKPSSSNTPTTTTTSTPSCSQPSTPTPTQILFPKHVTEEQEAYVRGFSQALEELYKKQGHPISSISNDDQLRCLESPNAFNKETKSTCFIPSSTVIPNIQSLSCSKVFSPHPSSSIDNLASNNFNYQPAFINLDQVSSFNRVPPRYQQQPNQQQQLSYVQSWPTEFQCQKPETYRSDYQNISTTIARSLDTLDDVSSFETKTRRSGAKKNPLAPVAKSSEILTNYVDSPLGTTNSSCDSDELSRVSSYTGSFTAVDMENQEKLRLERKRAKNRIAAQKCQLRKIERIQQLENKVNNLKQRNQILSERANCLRNAVDDLKRTINLHVSNGCRLLSPSAYNTFELIGT